MVLDFMERAGYNDLALSCLVGLAPCLFALVGCQARGFSLCAYGEPAACALLGKRLVQIAVNLLERGGIKPV